MNEQLLELYWSEIPTGKENAVTYVQLCVMWGRSSRSVRAILHELSRYDNGDNMILIRSVHGDGFYKTDNHDEIIAYRRECLNRGRNTFAPLRKIDRVLQPSNGQLTMTNNIKELRIAAGMTQTDVCKQMQLIDPAFDSIMLSKMENGYCCPTPLQLAYLASILRCKPLDLVNVDLYSEII